MDTSYWWSILAAAIGVAAGFQGVYERYGKDAFPGIATVPGSLYLGSRGAVPALTYWIVVSTGAVGEYPWATALLCGTASEALLRAKFFVKKIGPPAEHNLPVQPHTSGNPPQPDIMVGPLDLLNWWQKLALTSIGFHLAEKRLRFVERNMPVIDDFVPFCQHVKDRLASITDRAVASDVISQIDVLCERFTTDSSANASRYRTKLGLLLYDKLARQEFKTVVRVD